MKDSNAKSLQEMPLPPLSIPSLAWIEALNIECRTLNIPIRDRPLRALATWAKENGQDEPWQEIWLSHHASDAFAAIYTYMCEHTSYLREQHGITLRKGCFFYEETFWKVQFSPGAMMLPADAIYFVYDLPASVRKLLKADESAKEQLRFLWMEWIYNGVNTHLFEPPLVPPHACSFFRGAEKSLASAVTDLLSDPPNPKAAEQCRDAFECALKALAAAKGGRTEDALKSIGHDLSKLVGCCAPFVSDANEVSRLESAWHLYPVVEARYGASNIPRSKLWKCYLEAMHTIWITLRIVTGLIDQDYPRIARLEGRD